MFYCAVQKLKLEKNFNTKSASFLKNKPVFATGVN
jgi:hypothetical protein